MIVRIAASSCDALDMLGPAWRELESCAAPNVFLTFDWLAAWWNTQGRSSDPFVIGVHDDEGRLLGIAPLTTVRRPLAGPLGLRTLRFAGSRPSGGLGFLSRPEHGREVAEAVARYLHRMRPQWHVLEFDGLVDGAPEMAALRSTFERDHVIELVPGPSLPFLAIEGEWATYLASRSASARRELGRRRRRFEDDLGGRMITCADQDAVRAALTFLVEHSIERLGRSGMPSAFANANLRAFHLEAARALLELGRLEVHCLQIGGETAAVNYTLRFGDKIWGINSAFDPRWRSYGLGRTLLEYTLERAFDRGAAEFEFGPGEQRYKEIWTTRSRTHWRLAVYGRGAFVALQATKRMKRVRTSLRQWVLPAHEKP